MINKIFKLLAIFLLIYIVSYAIGFYYPWKTVSANLSEADPPFPSQNFTNLLWFVQVSDIHISIYQDPKRGPDFEDFCTTTLDVIQPELVLVTGDLTDAKDKTRFISEQYKQEWMLYHDIIEKSRAAQKYKWIDVRGNHDAFDVKSKNDKNSYYMKYSGDKGRLSRTTLTLSKQFGNYSFIPVDATLTPGPRRPINFMGYLSQERLDILYKEGQESMTSNFTFWYGHFPSSVISSASSFGLRDIIGKFGDVYLNGHLHDLQGIAPIQYALHSNGFLELEVKDWMQHRIYRIVAVDHDLLSFVDVEHGDWPVVLITNPKPATFMIPKHEPISRIRNSTHIRFLVFSTSPIDHVTVSIDSTSLDQPQHVQGPLWVSRWDPSLYMKGMHKLTVDVTDKQGRHKSTASVFSLDNQWTTDFALTGLILLLTDICTVFHVLFILLALVSLAVLIVVKRYGVTRSDRCLFKLNLLLSDDLTFYSIFLFNLNMLIGPLFIGELLTDQIGIGFSFGLFVDGNFIVECTIYAFCTMLILFSYLPAVYYLTHIADMRWAKQWSFFDSLTISRNNIIAHLLFLLHLCQQFRSIRIFYMSYGWLTLILSPAYTWWLVVTFLLVIRTWRRPITMLR